MATAETRGISEEQSNLERHIERQMGCMAGFLQIFDRNQILTGRRLYSAKRLPSSTITGSTSPSERSEASVAPTELLPSSPESQVSAADVMPARPSSPLPLPMFDFKDGTKSSWKLREAPRLSLDSRAIVDGKGKIRPREIRTAPPAAAAPAEEPRRSPSVVARLMGLDALPNSGVGAGGGVENGFKSPELRRSASESRVSSKLTHYRFMDPPPISSSSNEQISISSRRNLKADSTATTPIVSIHRKGYFEDVFPDPPAAKRIAGSVYDEVERRLRMRGIHEPAKDLETLKQILEAIQLKGLLHSNPRHNLVVSCDSPIVLMKPGPRPSAPSRRSQASPPSPPASRGRREMDRSVRPGQRLPDPGSPPVRGRRQANAEPQRRVSPVSSPRIGARKAGSDPVAVRSPRNRRMPAETPPKERRVWSAPEDVTSSQLDFEGGRRLLERCDKLLHSIAAMTEAEKLTGGDGSHQQPQPSPVSVLDASSFLSDESSPSPPLAKRSIHFGEELAELEDEEWEKAMSVVRSKEGIAMDDRDFIYVSEIIRASDGDRDSNLYLMLEKRHQPGGAGGEEASQLQRQLVFDAVSEILDRRRYLLPWDLFAGSHAFAGPVDECCRAARMVGEVWSELGRIRVHIAADEMDDVAGGAIMKDMGGDGKWTGCPSVEMSDAVLNIERLIFKDLVADTIRDLAAAVQFWPALPRRKLLF